MQIEGGMRADCSSRNTQGATVLPWLAVTLDAAFVLVATGAWSMGYGEAFVSVVAGWGIGGAALTVSIALALAAAYRAVRRAFAKLSRQMIDRELELEALAETFRALRFPLERHHDDLPTCLSRVLHDAAPVPVGRSLAEDMHAEGSCGNFPARV